MLVRMSSPKWRPIWFRVQRLYIFEIGFKVLQTVLNRFGKMFQHGFIVPDARFTKKNMGKQREDIFHVYPSHRYKTIYALSDYRPIYRFAYLRTYLPTHPPIYIHTYIHT